MNIKERTAARQKRIVAHRAAGFEDAENWDLTFWQSQTPEQRLSALVAIRRDVIKVEQARFHNKTADIPRHQEDARVLREVKKRLTQSNKAPKR